MSTLLYPAAKLLCILLGLWRSFKALKRRSPSAIKAYVVFWLVIMCYKTVESVADTFISWIPFYTWAKLVFILWFIIAQTSASNVMYQSFVRDFFARREALVDEIVDKLRQSTVRWAADVEKQARVALVVAQEGYTLLKSILLPLVNHLRPARQEKTEPTGSLIDVGVSVNTLSHARIRPPMPMSTAASNRTREHQARSEDVLWPVRQTSSVVIPGTHSALTAASSSSFPSTAQQNVGAMLESMRPPTRAYDSTLRYSAATGYQSDLFNVQNTRPASKAQFDSTTDGRQPTMTPHEWSSSSAQTVRAAHAPPAAMHAPTTYTYPHQPPARHTSSSQNPKAASTFWNDSSVASKNHTAQPVLVATTPWIPGGFIRPPQPAQTRARSTSSGLTDDDLNLEAERQRAERTEQIVRGLLADLGPRLRSERGEDGRVAVERAKPTVALKAAREVNNHPTDDDTPIVRERAPVPPIKDDQSLTKPPLRPAAVTATTTAATTAKRPRPDAPDPLARAKGIKKSRIAMADALSLRSTKHKLKPVAGAEVEREPRAVPVGRGRRHDAKVASVAAPVRRRRARGIEEEEKKGGKRVKDGMVDVYDAPREVVGKGKRRRTGSIDRVVEEEWKGNGKETVERKRQDKGKAEEPEERQKLLQNGRRKRMADDDDVEDGRAAGRRELRNENKVVVTDEEEEEEEKIGRVEMVKSKGRGRRRESVGATRDMGRHVEVAVGIV